MKPYYETKLGKLYHGDCLEIMPQLDRVELVVTSPPYNTGDKKACYGESKYIHPDKYDDESYRNLIFGSLKRMVTISRLTVFNIQMVSRNKKMMWELFGEFFENIKELVIWDKISGEPAALPRVMNSAFEFIFLLTNERPDTRQFADDMADFHGTIDNVIRYKKTKPKRWAKHHRALFPKYIPQWAVDNFGSNYGVVLDPFFGLGTTAIVCEEQNRKWIGIEISEKYCEIAAKRIESEASQLKLFT
jgi:site-specific DNA-methyltransferase (adenine-specific)